MKLIATVKLNTTPEQSQALLQTIERANVVCNRLSEFAWEHQVFGQYALHSALYSILRLESGLTAQVVVRAISKVADAYKLDKKVQRVFTPHGSIAYDDRILRWDVQKRQVSIWTVDGRIKLPFSCGEPQQKLLKSRQGESDLVYREGEWFLFATCNVEEPPAIHLKGVLGVDLGIAEIAFDSLGNSYSGEGVKSLRQRVKKHRSGLQHQANKHQSKSAYRRLCKQRRRQSRFVKHTNHVISKALVQTALVSSKAIAMELLQGIRWRVSASKEMRWLLGNWAFDQLQKFVAYKAQAVGIPVVFVDPAYTSRTCSRCGFCDKQNRKSQSRFHCLSCGLDINADFNASLNIEARGSLVTAPMVGAPAMQMRLAKAPSL